MLSAPAAPFEHPALFYHGNRDYLPAMMRFISNGLNAGEPVMIAVPPRNLDLVCSAFGNDADAFESHDMTIAGRNPARIIHDVLLNFAGKHAGRRVRVVGEPIWAGRDSDEYPACAQHEALINVAFADVAATILCPYNLTELDPQVIDDAKRTHPTLWTESTRRHSENYTGGEAAADSFNLPLPPSPEHADDMAISGGTVDETRRFTASHALAAGLVLHRVADAVLAIDELVSNTVTHGGGSGRLSAWTDDNRLVYQVSDRGHITDRLAGRRPSGPEQAGVRGLAIVNRLSDLARMHTTPDGTTIRAYFNR